MPATGRTSTLTFREFLSEEIQSLPKWKRLYLLAPIARLIDESHRSGKPINLRPWTLEIIKHAHGVLEIKQNPQFIHESPEWNHDPSLIADQYAFAVILKRTISGDPKFPIDSEWKSLIKNSTARRQIKLIERAYAKGKLVKFEPIASELRAQYRWHMFRRSTAILASLLLLICVSFYIYWMWIVTPNARREFERARAEAVANGYAFTPDAFNEKYPTTERGRRAADMAAEAYGLIPDFGWAYIESWNFDPKEIPSGEKAAISIEWAEERYEKTDLRSIVIDEGAYDPFYSMLQELRDSEVPTTEIGVTLPSGEIREYLDQRLKEYREHNPLRHWKHSMLAAIILQKVGEDESWLETFKDETYFSLAMIPNYSDSFLGSARFIITLRNLIDLLLNLIESDLISEDTMLHLGKFTDPDTLSIDYERVLARQYISDVDFYLEMAGETGYLPVGYSTYVYKPCLLCFWVPDGYRDKTRFHSLIHFLTQSFFNEQVIKAATAATEIGVAQLQLVSAGRVTKNEWTDFEDYSAQTFAKLNSDTIVRDVDLHDSIYFHSRGLATRMNILRAAIILEIEQRKGPGEMPANIPYLFDDYGFPPPLDYVADDPETLIDYERFPKDNLIRLSYEWWPNEDHPSEDFYINWGDPHTTATIVYGPPIMKIDDDDRVTVSDFDVELPSGRVVPVRIDELLAPHMDLEKLQPGTIINLRKRPRQTHYPVDGMLIFRAFVIEDIEILAN